MAETGNRAFGGLRPLAEMKVNTVTHVKALTWLSCINLFPIPRPLVSIRADFHGKVRMKIERMMALTFSSAGCLPPLGGLLVKSHPRSLSRGRCCPL